MMEGAGDELAAPGDLPKPPGKIPKGYQHWCTPPEVVEVVHRMFGGIPDLDPFSNGDSVTGARVQLREGWGCGWDPWHTDYETVFVNPPWRQTQRAIAKCEEEWRAVRGREVIGLFPAGCNSTSWPIVLRAPARCFPHKRVTFWAMGEPAPTGADKNVVLVYWGHDQYRFREVFRELGEVVFG